MFLGRRGGFVVGKGILVEGIFRMGDEEKKYIKSVEKALDVLLLFSTEEQELAHVEIARKMGWTTSTASRFLSTLLKKDFLLKNEENGKYRLGHRIYYLGALVRNNAGLRRVGLPVMERINRETQETVHIFVRDGIHRVCVEQVDSPQKIRMASEIGVRDKLWVGCTGRVLLAYCPEEKRERLFQQILEAEPGVDVASLRDKIMRVRQRGFSSKDGPWDRHCGCAAAPIFNADGKLEGCLAISTPDFRFPEDVMEYASLVMEGADEISKKMGYLGRRKGGGITR